MVLLASSYDQSRFFKAADLDAEKKLRIKSVTEEQVGVGAEQQKKLVVSFINDERGLVLNKTNNRVLRGAFGDDCAGWVTKISCCSRRRSTSVGRWSRRCGCEFRHEAGDGWERSDRSGAGRVRSTARQRRRPHSRSPLTI